MMDNHQRRLMHEALDDELTPESLDELYAGLDADPQGATVFERLRHVDRLLKEAPFEGAPQTLALRVLAKIAELQPEQLRRGAGLLLALSISLVALLLLPLMSVLGWMLIHALSNPAAAIGAVIGALSSLAVGLVALIQSAQAALQASPLLPAALAALIPAGYLALRQARRRRLDRERRERLGTSPADEE